MAKAKETMANKPPAATPRPPQAAVMSPLTAPIVAAVAAVAAVATRARRHQLLALQRAAAQAYPTIQGPSRPRLLQPKRTQQQETPPLVAPPRVA